MKVLLAEDDLEISKIVTKYLKMNNVDVDPVYDGESAFDYATLASYDVVILDVMMPKMDGFTVLQKLRTKGYSKPIIMLTALASVEDKVKGLDYGADDYLAKPFSVKELLARIRALTRRNAEESSIYSYGSLTLDYNTFELKDKESVRLTSKEFKIMELLMQNKKQLTPTESIMDKVWDIETDTEINVVWVYIHSLRKKLSSIHSSYTIKSIRSLGYILDEN